MSNVIPFHGRKRIEATAEFDLRTRRLMGVWGDTTVRAARSGKEGDWAHAGQIGAAVLSRLREIGRVIVIETVARDQFALEISMTDRSVQSSDIPPLVPADVDLREFASMPLDVRRLRDSGSAVLLTGDEFRAAFLLWCEAWHQVPASSLPNDDLLLADHAGFGRDFDGWRRVRTGALKGFVLCSDGRLYHPTIATIALECWERRGD